MSRLVYLILSFVIGLFIALHLTMNAACGKMIGSTRAANFVFWSIGAFVAFLIWLLFPQRVLIKEISSVNPLLLTAGAMGAVLILGVTWLVPKLGAGPMMVLLLAGQVVMATLLSHFGSLNLPQSPINLIKIIGVIFMLLGAYLVGK